MVADVGYEVSHDMIWYYCNSEVNQKLNAVHEKKNHIDIHNDNHTLDI